MMHKSKPILQGWREQEYTRNVILYYEWDGIEEVCSVEMTIYERNDDE